MELEIEIVLAAALCRVTSNSSYNLGAGDRGYAVPTVDIHTHKHGHSMTQTVGTAC
jgi:hypothetical protein